MGDKTGIPWCDKTFSTHWGCTEVSAECDHCYAREFDKRFGGENFGGEHWGKDAPRRFFGDNHWNNLLRWNRAAERGAVGKDGRRIIVFVDSMSDLFESREDLDPVRERFWNLARQCRSLILMLLTKRPQNIGRMVPQDLRGARWIWYGTTVGLPESLWRADALNELAAHAPIRFLSMEPLLAETPIARVLGANRMNYVIAGSESGDGARPMATDWMRRTRDECAAAGVPFFAKQADEGADGIAALAPGVTPSHWLPGKNAPYRRRDLRSRGDGSKRVHWIVERPYLDGKQHVEWPQ